MLLFQRVSKRMLLLGALHFESTAKFVIFSGTTFGEKIHFANHYNWHSLQFQNNVPTLCKPLSSRGGMKSDIFSEKVTFLGKKCPFRVKSYIFLGKRLSVQ